MSVSSINASTGDWPVPSQPPPDPVARLTDASGNVSKDVFVSKRPQGVSEDEAAQLWNKIDTAGAGTISAASLREGLASNRPHSGPRSPPQAEAATSRITPLLSDSTVSSLLSELQQGSGGQDSNQGPPPPRESLA